ncbi:MAG: hypothetical protein GX998_00380 [Firmicutes bacterium]|nr:hypothetical protein [Bacillota bacterium]
MTRSGLGLDPVQVQTLLKQSSKFMMAMDGNGFIMPRVSGGYQMYC